MNNQIKLTPDLAECIGIYVGDGYLRYHGYRKELDISGGYEEQEYYDDHVIPLFNKVFGLSIKGRFFPSRKTYGFWTSSNVVIETFKNLGFPSGAKSLIIFVPDVIKYSENKLILTRFLRGYFDTDGCVTFRNRTGGKSYSKFKQKYHYYPRIQLISVSKKLIGDVGEMLEQLGFNFYNNSYDPKNINWKTTHRILIVGDSKIANWLKIIGTGNVTKSSRFEIWEKFGFCPPFTNYNQRINILAGKLDPYTLYGPVM
jgi:intein/homing endonuclease